MYFNYFLLPFQKYATFTGRARRKEYWSFVFGNTVIYLVFGIFGVDHTPVAVIGGLYLLFTIIPGFAVATRRLHDLGKSAWWLLVGFIPIVGPFIAIFLACLDSQPGTNVYGPNPKILQKIEII